MGKKKPKSRATKPAVADPDPSFKANMEMIAAAICSANRTVFMKVCRLCESKDGPFLNIFDADKITAKKIDELMPFRIAENDDLPHKICFRCSAKVEELYEFIQKCIKTQQSLHTALGKKEPLAIKTKTRAIWEEKLNKSNISNDDICDALIKKAMEGIKDIPLKPGENEDKTTPLKKDSKSSSENTTKQKPITDPKSESDNEKDVPLKQLKLTLDTYEKKFIPKRTSRSQNQDGLLDGLPDYKRNKKLTSKQSLPDVDIGKSRKKSSEEEGSSDIEFQAPVKQKEETAKPVEPVDPPKPFDIMEHISIIKVNGVGVLFQCKLCNRNFLKKDVVLTHGCAKNGGVPKVDFIKNIIPPEPPRAPVVKYINTKTDGELGKSIENKTAKPQEEVKKEAVVTKPKPKIGPASRVKRGNNNPMIGMTVAPIEETKPKQTSPPKAPPPATAPSLQFPAAPSLNSRYKLVPGPNNTFQLVEESSQNDASLPTEESTSKSSQKRKIEEPTPAVESKTRKSNGKSKMDKKASTSHSSDQSAADVIDLEGSSPEPEKQNSSQPYPVGLFSTLSHHSNVYPPPITPDPPFTTPAMKKQSYTIVQTGNPSKLLLSTKPQPQAEESSKKRQKKSKHESKEDTSDRTPQQQQSFNVTLEDTAHPKDSFFTFINVDPLLQPSYVLPTDNIIQESQISTSTPASKGNAESKDKDKYSCNMCNEKFSREKKLLAHIHSHYKKMDEEDMLREKSNKKHGRKC